MRWIPVVSRSTLSMLVVLAALACKKKEPSPAAPSPSPAAPASPSQGGTGAGSMGAGGTGAGPRASLPFRRPKPGGVSAGTLVPHTSPSTQGTGLPRAKKLADLSGSDIQRICDWSAGLYGGYGKTIACPDHSTVSGPADLADCAAEWRRMAVPGCSATVGVAEQCLNTSATDPCGWEMLKDPPCVQILKCDPEWAKLLNK